jgi:hypothetical protein
MWNVGYDYLGRNALGNDGVEPPAQRFEIAIWRGDQRLAMLQEFWPTFRGETRRNQGGRSPACQRLVQCERPPQDVGPEAQHHLSLGRAAPGTVGMIASRITNSSGRRSTVIFALPMLRPRTRPPSPNWTYGVQKEFRGPSIGVNCDATLTAATIEHHECQSR